MQQAYAWTVPTGATIISGSTTSSITVNYSVTAVSGNITVNGINSCGNGTTSAAYTVTVNPLPANAGAISGPSAVCVSQTGYIYTVPVITDATDYVWSLPADATITSGDHTNTITVSYGAASVAGNISVYGVNTCGNGVASANYAVTVSQLVGAAGTISGTNDVCQGQNGVVYSVAAIDNATGYSWTLPGGASIVLGNNTNSITVNYSNTAT